MIKMANRCISEESWVSHLGFIQGVITRMAQNSYLLKGWWPDPVFCTRCYESVSTDSSSSGFSASFTFVSRSAATANSAGVR